MSLVPQIPPYQEPEGIVTTANRPLAHPRPIGGYTYDQHTDFLMDGLIRAMWPNNSVWEIACAVQDLVGQRITARQIWGAKQRLDVADREAQKN